MKEKSNPVNIKEMTFDLLFIQVSPEAICDNVFMLAGIDFFAITAGKADLYNSMIGSGGGWAALLKVGRTGVIALA